MPNVSQVLQLAVTGGVATSLCQVHQTAHNLSHEGSHQSLGTNKQDRVVSHFCFGMEIKTHVIQL